MLENSCSDSLNHFLPSLIFLSTGKNSGCASQWSHVSCLCLQETPSMNDSHCTMFNLHHPKADLHHPLSEPDKGEQTGGGGWRCVRLQVANWFTTDDAAASSVCQRPAEQTAFRHRYQIPSRSGRDLFAHCVGKVRL